MCSNVPLLIKHADRCCFFYFLGKKINNKTFKKILCIFGALQQQVVCFSQQIQDVIIRFLNQHDFNFYPNVLLCFTFVILPPPLCVLLEGGSHWQSQVSSRSKPWTNWFCSDMVFACLIWSGLLLRCGEKQPPAPLCRQLILWWVNTTLSHQDTFFRRRSGGMLSRHIILSAGLFRAVLTCQHLLDGVHFCWVNQ